MFSKSKITEPIDPPQDQASAKTPTAPASPPPSPSAPAAPAKPKTSPSVLSSDLTITGNVTTTGDVQVEGAVEGDIHAHMLTVGETATIRGEVVADDVVVHGRVVGRLRGLKVRLTSTAKVEGDIIHKTIAIESGAHFEGSVQRSDDPLGDGGKPRPTPSAASQASSAPGASSAKSEA